MNHLKACVSLSDLYVTPVRCITLKFGLPVSEARADEAFTHFKERLLRSLFACDPSRALKISGITAGSDSNREIHCVVEVPEEYSDYEGLGEFNEYVIKNWYDIDRSIGDTSVYDQGVAIQLLLVNIQAIR